ncbi:MAG: hypothetical protein HKN25_11270 [Pyrinomonadaceae bacterium]|nr:hypothetical protein [Pyrinomonadaceae bacterium]
MADKDSFRQGGNKILLAVFLLFSSISTDAQTSDSKKKAINSTAEIVSVILTSSYPEIKPKKIHYKTFDSDTNFFKARFSNARYLTFQKMRHLIYVNPKVFSLGAPKKGVQAIVAHELAHVWYYTKKNRFELLGLASLLSKGFTRKFERKADLEAISRGYGEGLIEYREWLYKNIPQEKVPDKRKNYFSPEEIKLIIKILKTRPKMIRVWKKKVPLNIEQIRNTI